MKLILAKASTNVTLYVFILDTSANDGTGLTGLVWNSGSLVASYVRPLAARAAISLATQTVTGAHSDGGFVEVDATNMPGLYRLDLPDAVCASGVDNATVILKGAANMAPIVAEIQLSNLDLNAAIEDTIWDEVLTGATHNVATSAGRRLRGIQEFQGYEDGAIWIDTVNGTAGTTDYENGTVENPVDSIADANTLAASLNINRFRIAPASSITFAATQSDQVFYGDAWTLALGGQDISGSTIIGATVSGIASGTGSTQIFEKCIMGATSHIKGTHLLECGIAGTQTLVEAGDFFTDRCHSGVAGTGTPTLDVGAAIGNSNVNMRNYSGGIQLESFGDSGTDTMSLEGRGQLVEGTCTGGVVAIRGNFTVSGITNLTLSDDARLDVDQVAASVLAQSLAAESYAADGAVPTLSQMLYQLWSALGDFSISGTTMTCKKLDGSTTSMTFTLNDGTNPTSRTRAT